MIADLRNAEKAPDRVKILFNSDWKLRPDIRLIFRTAVYYHINIEFLIFLVCIDLASFENLKNEELFRLFTYGHTFSWDFFELFERYNSLSDVYKHAASTFLEAASICNQQI